MQIQTEILERQKKAYLIADLLKVNDEYNALGGDEARKAYILSRKQKVQDIISVLRQSRCYEMMLIGFHISSIRQRANLGQVRRPAVGTWSCANSGKRGRLRELTQQISITRLLTIFSSLE